MRASSGSPRSWLFLGCLVFALWPSASASAQQSAVGPQEAAAIRQVIASQIAAFRQDDGDTAFGLATPTLRREFGTAENFMRMVKGAYSPVYRPRDVDFGMVDDLAGVPVQHVLVIAPDGTRVEALYFMERQADGTWRISGCVLTRSEDKPA